MLKSFRLPLKIVLGILFSVVIVFALLLIHLESHLPSVEVLRDVQLQVPLKIYSADGKLIAEYGDKRRTPLKLEQIPPLLVNAVIATEDRRFYKHPGVDLRGILRAVVNLVTKRNKEQGGSTITMQVARNFFLTRNKTYIRKLNEILLALKIEQELTKEEILELYFNKIYFGKRAYGIAAAAEVYYGTTVDKLTLGQMAMLAGLPQAPSAINPLQSPESATKRRAHVLERMLSCDLITKEEYLDALSEPITTVYHGRPIEVQAYYLAEMVRQQLVGMYGEDVYDRGYQVVTTINYSMQHAANNAVARSLLEYDQRHGYRGPVQNVGAGADFFAALRDIPSFNKLVPAAVTKVDAEGINILLKNNVRAAISGTDLTWGEASTYKVGDIIYVTPKTDGQWRVAQVPLVEGALVALDAHSGEILALVGGFDYDRSTFNRAVQSSRQPGSSFKPFIYAAALENNFTAASIINDAPFMQDDASSDEWRPRNDTREFYGPTRLRIGLAHSRNLVSIRLLQSMGIQSALNSLKKMGLAASKLPRNLSLALGTNQLSPLDLAVAYSIFPNHGRKVHPYFIKQITDYQGNVIYTAPEMAVSEAVPEVVESINDVDMAEEEQVDPDRAISTQNAYILTSILQDVIKHGTGRKAQQLGRSDLAGKTGTTSDQFDGWFAGFNRDLVVTTWMGFDEPKSLREYASGTALPMWMYFMEQALKGKPEHSFVQPKGIVTVKIDPLTGLLARDGQADAIFEVFAENNVPHRTAADRVDNGANAADQQILESDNLF